MSNQRPRSRSRFAALSYYVTGEAWVTTAELQAPLDQALRRLWEERDLKGIYGRVFYPARRSRIRDSLGLRRRR